MSNVLKTGPVIEPARPLVHGLTGSTGLTVIEPDN
jgi:hypothetical protein